MKDILKQWDQGPEQCVCTDEEGGKELWDAVIKEASEGRPVKHIAVFNHPNGTEVFLGGVRHGAD